MHQLSIWETQSFFRHRDIIIVGSGFVGLWSAYHLKKRYPRKKILMVDGGLIPTGASTRNAGFACFGSVTELIADTLHHGEEQTLEIVEMRFRGLEKINETFSNKQIGFESFGGYELISDSQQIELGVLRSNIDYLNRKLRKIVGTPKAFRLHDSAIKAFGFAGVSHLIENKFEAQLHPGRLCQALLKKVQSMGVTVLSSTTIKNFTHTDQPIRLETSRGITLNSDQLLICTNAFARELLPELDVEPARGQVLVTSPIPGLRFRGTFHFDEGFYYFRNLGERVLLGGARNKAFQEEHTATMETTDLIQGELEKFLRETIIPGASVGIDYRWSGIMGMGGAKMPIVRQIAPGIFCAVRMSGMGVALAPVIGEQIAKMMKT